MSIVAKLTDFIREAGHVMGKEDGLAAYHAARRLRDAKRVRDPITRLTTARQAVKAFRVRVELADNGITIKTMNGDKSHTF